MLFLAQLTLLRSSFGVQYDSFPNHPLGYGANDGLGVENNHYFVKTDAGACPHCDIVNDNVVVRYDSGVTEHGAYHCTQNGQECSCTCDGSVYGSECKSLEMNGVFLDVSPSQDKCHFWTPCPGGNDVEYYDGTECKSCDTLPSCLTGKYRLGCGGNQEGFCTDCNPPSLLGNLGAWGFAQHTGPGNHGDADSCEQDCTGGDNVHYILDGVCLPCEYLPACPVGQYRSGCGPDSGSGQCVDCTSNKGEQFATFTTSGTVGDPNSCSEDSLPYIKSNEHDCSSGVNNGDKMFMVRKWDGGNHNGGEHTIWDDYRYNMGSLNRAEEACAHFGADVCSEVEMNWAQQEGWNVCSWMFTSDGKMGYPMTWQGIAALSNVNDCGGESPGVRRRDNGAGRKGNACCIEHTGTLNVVVGPTSRETWGQAQLKCSQMNPPRHLSEPHNSAANAVIRSVMASKNSAHWIGVTDYLSEGKFILTATGNYKNWAPHEPNSSGGQEDCVEMYTDGKWNDLSCDNRRPYSCELPLYTSIMGPSSVAQAHATCAKYNNGRVAAPRNTAENNMLKNLGVTLIGIDDEDHEDSFMLHGAKGMMFQNWKSGEPNNGGWFGSAEDCVQMYATGSNAGKWNDVSCSGSNWKFVCEYNRLY